MLDALAAVGAEIFLDLAGIAGILVDRNPDFAVRAGQRAREQPGGAAFDVEEANLTEVEQFFVKPGPDVHAAAMDVVGEMVEIKQPRAHRPWIPGAEPFEFAVVGGTVGAVTIDEIQQAAANALDRGNVERFLRGRNLRRLCAKRDRALIGLPGVDHPEGHRRRAWSVRGDEGKAVRARLLVDEIIDVALPIDRDLFGPVAGDRNIAHQPEQRVQLFRLRMRVFDEFKTVGTHWIVGADGGGRRLMRKWSHGGISLIWLIGVSVEPGAKCMQMNPRFSIILHVSCIKRGFYAWYRWTPSTSKCWLRCRTMAG